MKRSCIVGLLLGAALSAQADSSTGWVQRLEFQPPAPGRIEMPGGLLLRWAGDEWPNPGGVPDLPGLVQPLAGQPGYRIGVKIVDAEFEEEEGIRIVAAPGHRRTLVADNQYAVSEVREPDAGIYARDEFWPAALARVDEAWQGTNRLARLELRPVQWNPQRGVLRIYSRLVVEVVFQPE